jgi:hypothetical protein
MMKRRNYHRLGHDGLAVAGVCGIVCGVALWSLPAALITAGVFLLLAGLWWAYAVAHQHMRDDAKETRK